VTRLGPWLAAVAALLATTARAQSPVDPLASGTLPRAYALQVSLTGLGATPEPRAAALIDAAVGLPWKFHVRARLPVLYGDQVALGSASVAAGLHSGLSLGRVELGTIVEAEGIAPSTVVFADSHVGRLLTSRSWSVRINALGRVGLKGIPVSLLTDVYVTLAGETAATARLRWTSNAGDAIQAGVRYAPTDGNWAAVGELTMRPIGARNLRLTVFVDYTVTRPAAVAAGLGLQLPIDLRGPSDPVELTPRAGDADVADVRVRAQTQLEELAVPGKTTVVEMGATWCGPCNAMAPKLLALAARRPELALRFVDVDDSAAFASALDVSSIPELIVLLPDGHLLKRGMHSLAELEAALDHPDVR
jgi:thioredoxin 1